MALLVTIVSIPIEAHSVIRDGKRRHWPLTAPLLELNLPDSLGGVGSSEPLRHPDCQIGLALWPCGLVVIPRRSPGPRAQFLPLIACRLSSFSLVFGLVVYFRHMSRFAR